MQFSDLDLGPFFDKYSFLKGSTIAVALSGGADSVCLLHLLCSAKEKYGITVFAAHLNHGIRGADADADAAFCKRLCDALGVELVAEKISVLDQMLAGESVELAARRLRYRFFESLRCDFVATAHNKDDCAETILFNLIRGTGPRGLYGIPEIRGNIIRPLLSYKKCDILNYCKRHDLEFVTDKTNLENDYSRNKIRNLVFPVLNDINSGFVDNIIKCAGFIKNDGSMLDDIAKQYFNSACKNGSLDLKKLNGLNISVLSRVLMLYFNKAQISADSCVIKKLSEVIMSCYDGDPFYAAEQNADNKAAIQHAKNDSRLERLVFKINLPRGDHAVIKNGLLFLEDKTAAKKEFVVQTQIINNLLLKNTIDCDKIIGKLVISKRMPGDKIRLPGAHSKEIRKIYNERRIPAKIRESLPVARDDEGPVWAYLVGTAERALPDKNSKKIIRFDVREKDVDA